MAHPSLSENETKIVALVTRAFEGMDFQVVTMNRTDAGGGQMEVLPFTLDDAYSSELGREQVAAANESPEAMAARIANDLRGQMPRLSTSKVLTRRGRMVI